MNVAKRLVPKTKRARIRSVASGCDFRGVAMPVNETNKIKGDTRRGSLCSAYAFAQRSAARGGRRSDIVDADRVQLPGTDDVAKGYTEVSPPHLTCLSGVNVCTHRCDHMPPLGCQRHSRLNPKVKVRPVSIGSVSGLRRGRDDAYASSSSLHDIPSGHAWHGLGNRDEAEVGTRLAWRHP
jgi:hypothetical protein